MSLTMSHQSVMCEESVAALITRKEGIYVDQTFGCGGHSKAILNQLGQNGRLIAFDKDLEAVAIGLALAKTDKRFCIVHSDFSNFDAALDRMGVDAIDGAIFDLGVSSPQLDDAKRGFSFRFDAPLDMRMDTTAHLTAAIWLNQATPSEIQRVIREYGEERFAGNIAKAIVRARALAPIATTSELAMLVKKEIKTYEAAQHPATRTFQAIRIYINDELSALTKVLPKVMRYLRCGGKLVVISFHSLEDRIVKRFMRFHHKNDHLPRWAMVRNSQLPAPLFEKVDPMRRASDQEIASNPRARSAVLRVARRSGVILEEK